MMNEVVVTPYSTDITSRLASICDEFAKNLSIYDLDSLLKSFVCNHLDMDFKGEIEKKYDEMYPNEASIVLPPIFIIVFSQYIVYKAITDYFNNQDKATASLMLMNYMLCRKGSLRKLILPKFIKGMYYEIDKYIDLLNDFEEDGDYKHLKGLLKDKNYLNKHIQDSDFSDEIRRMAITTYRFHQQKLINEHRSLDEQHSYVKVYNFIYILLTQTHWKYTKNDIVSLLSNVLSKEVQKKTATIDSIVTELKKAQVQLPFSVFEDSSLLLRFVSGEEMVPEDLKTKRLTLMEFGVYVYYELLLEFIIDEYYGDSDEK